MIHYSRLYAFKLLTASSWSYLPMPARGIARPLGGSGAVQTLLSGAPVLDNLNMGLTWATWTLPFTRLDDDAAKIVQDWAYGAHGVGPYNFTDNNGATTYRVIIPPNGLADQVDRIGYHDMSLTVMECG